MEYANGVMEMFRIADDWGMDKTPATSTLLAAAQSDSPKGVRFDTSEPATIYYTTDGSTPTLESPRYKQTEFREPGETLWVEATTTFQWFSVDAAGDLEPIRSADGADRRERRPRRHGAGDAVADARRAGDLRRVHPGRGQGLHGHDHGERHLDRGRRGADRLDPGHLTNGTFTLPEPLVVEFSKASWTAPVSNDPVTITFKQHIGANDALRTGPYSKTLTFTLSTTNP